MVRNEREFGGKLAKLCNYMQAVFAERWIHVGHFQPHPRQGQEHLQENYRLHCTTGKLNIDISGGIFNVA